MAHPIALPANVLEALQRGNKIEAIKRLRAATGFGLKECKDAVEAHAHALPGANRVEATGSATMGFPPAAEQALARGGRVEAIRLVREQTGLGLKEATELVDAAERRASFSRADGAGANGLAPGEMPPSSGVGAWLLAGAVVAAVAAYLLF